MTKLRIVVGSDDAGFEYKETLKGDLLADDRVADVTDVGADHGGRRAPGVVGHQLEDTRGLPGRLDQQRPPGAGVEPQLALVLRLRR